MNSDPALHWVERAEWKFKVIKNVKYKGEGKTREKKEEKFCFKRLSSNSCTHILPSPS